MADKDKTTKAVETEVKTIEMVDLRCPKNTTAISGVRLDGTAYSYKASDGACTVTAGDADRVCTVHGFIR